MNAGLKSQAHSQSSSDPEGLWGQCCAADRGHSLMLCVFSRALRALTCPMGPRGQERVGPVGLAPPSQCPIPLGQLGSVRLTLTVHPEMHGVWLLLKWGGDP